MGNQLCPAATKDIIHGFQQLEKQQNQHPCLPLLNCCDTHQTQDEPYEFYFYQITTQQDSSNSKTTSQNSKDYAQSMILESNKVETGLIDDKNILEVHPHQTDIKQVVELILPNGWKYHGQAVAGVPEGRGEEIGPDGECYSGTFHQGRKEGFGIYKFGNGSIYKGQFKANYMWGHGTFQFINGDTFEGEFVKNRREGKGRYRLRQPNMHDLLYFQGEYRDDLKNGAGVMKYLDYQVRGEWRDGQYEYSFQSECG